MEYEKPEVTNLADTLSAIHGTVLKGVSVFAEYTFPALYFTLTPLAYAADE